MKTARLTELLMGEHVYQDSDGHRIEVPTSGGYGTVQSGLDRGKFTMGVIDVVDAEQALKLIDDDEAAKAAATLSLCGWKPEQLGGLFHPRLSKNRPGKRMLADAIQMVAARSRQQRLAVEARRAELRS